MSIFKFTTTKPSSLKIWTTLMETAISPREGYSSDQIRYRMFVLLQLAKNFKQSLDKCNNIISNEKTTLAGLLAETCALASCTEEHFSDLSIVSEAFPHWIEPELYTPYYLTKQLCMKLRDESLLQTLFDRSALLSEESKHIMIDYGDVPGLTAYKLLSPNATPTAVMEWVNISYNQKPIYVSSKDEIKMHIRGELLYALESADNYIIPEGSKITISYFVLTTATTVPPIPGKKGANKYTMYIPQTRSSSTTRAFVVGDRVRLRSDLVLNKEYGSLGLLSDMIFNGTSTITGITSVGNLLIDDNGFIYSLEMLEHAEGGTDASCQI